MTAPSKTNQPATGGVGGSVGDDSGVVNGVGDLREGAKDAHRTMEPSLNPSAPDEPIAPPAPDTKATKKWPLFIFLVVALLGAFALIDSWYASNAESGADGALVKTDAGLGGAVERVVGVFAGFMDGIKTTAAVAWSFIPTATRAGILQHWHWVLGGGAVLVLLVLLTMLRRRSLEARYWRDFVLQHGPRDGPWETAEIETMAHMAQAVSTLGDAIDALREATANATEGLIHSATTAKKGAAKSRTATAGLNNAGQQAETAPEQIKTLRENARQLHELVDETHSMIERADVLSVNAALRAGGGVAAAMEAVQRITDHLARNSLAITERARNMQNAADEVSRSMGEIEDANRALLKLMDGVDAAAQPVFDGVARLQAVSEKSAGSRMAADLSPTKAVADED